MKNRYSVYWFFGALVFFFLGALFAYQLAEAWVNGYKGSSPFDVRLLWLAVGVCLVLTVVCLACSQPLDLHNYCTRLERTVRGLKGALECYESNSEWADRHHLAKKALDKCGNTKIKYLDEEKRA